MKTTRNNKNLRRYSCALAAVLIICACFIMLPRLARAEDEASITIDMTYFPDCGEEITVTQDSNRHFYQSPVPAILLKVYNPADLLKQVETPLSGQGSDGSSLTWINASGSLFEGTMQGGNTYYLKIEIPMTSDLGKTLPDVMPQTDNGKIESYVREDDKITIVISFVPEHIRGSKISENYQYYEPACQGTGSHVEIVRCTECGITLEQNTVTDPAQPHVEEVTTQVLTQATCEKAGTHVDITTCVLCKQVLKRTQVTDPALGHLPVESDKGEQTAATCTEAGTHLLVTTCSRCGKELSTRTAIYGTPLGHNMSLWTITKEATTTEEGLQERHCLRAGCDYSETQTIPVTTDKTLPENSSDSSGNNSSDSSGNSSGNSSGDSSDNSGNSSNNSSENSNNSSNNSSNANVSYEINAGSGEWTKGSNQNYQIALRKLVNGEVSNDPITISNVSVNSGTIIPINDYTVSDDGKLINLLSSYLNQWSSGSVLTVTLTYDNKTYPVAIKIVGENSSQSSNQDSNQSSNQNSNGNYYNSGTTNNNSNNSTWTPLPNYYYNNGTGTNGTGNSRSNGTNYYNYYNTNSSNLVGLESSNANASVQTGDSGHDGLWVGMISVSLAALVGILFGAYRKKQSEG